MASGQRQHGSLNSALRDTGRRGAGSALRSTLGALRQVFTRPPAEAARSAVQSLSGFALAGDRMLREARRLRQPLSMAVFDFEELPDARDNHDRATFQGLLATVLATLGEVAGARGIVGHTGPAEFSLLLPGLTRHEAHALVHQRMGTPIRVEFRAGRRGDLMLMPSVEIEQAGPDVERIMELHDELRYDLDEASSCQRQYLQRLAREGGAAPAPMPAADLTPPTLAASLTLRASDAAPNPLSPLAAR